MSRFIGSGNPITTTKAPGIWDLRKIYNEVKAERWPGGKNLLLSNFNKFNDVGDPLDIHEWSSSANMNASTQTRDTSVTDSPYGGVPVRMNVTGNDPFFTTYNGSTWNIAAASTGQTWRVKVLAKASQATTGEIFIFGVNSSGSFLGGFGTNFSSGAVTIGSDWSECSHTFTFNDSDVAFIQTRLDGPPTGGSGINIWFDGLQVYNIT